MNIRHFQREESQGNAIVCSNILSHRQGERGLTHSGASCHNDKIASLPAGGDIVKFVIACCNTRQSVLICSSGLDTFNGLRDHGVDLRIVLLHVALTQLKERVLGLLHQFVDVVGFIKCLRLDDTGKGDELSGQEFLGNDICVVLDISRGCHP